MIIQGADNPGYSAHVDRQGRLETHSTSRSEETVAAIDEEAFNLNTDNTTPLTLTSATETPLFYFKNVGEEKKIIISRLFLYTGASTGGSGPAFSRVVYNPTGGSLLTNTAINITNFNAGSGNEIDIDATVGGTGITVTGGTSHIRTLFPTVPITSIIQFDPPMVLPRGASMALLFTPPAGNTSLRIMAGINLYLEAD